MSDELTEHSPAGLAAPDPETEDGPVVCPGCGDARPASEMKMSMDRTNMDGEDNVLSVERFYVCSEDCSLELMFGGGVDG